MTDKPDTPDTSPAPVGAPGRGGVPRPTTTRGDDMDTIDAVAVRLPRGYARCGVCGGTYRPSSRESAASHEEAQGHPPRPEEPPTSRGHPHEPDRDRVTVGGLLVHAAATVGQLQEALEAERARLELLEQLAAAWADTDSGDLHEAARMVRGVLARPAVFAQGQEGEARAEAGL